MYICKYIFVHYHIENVLCVKQTSFNSVKSVMPWWYLCYSDVLLMSQSVSVDTTTSFVHSELSTGTGDRLGLAAMMYIDNSRRNSFHVTILQCQNNGNTVFMQNTLYTENFKRYHKIYFISSCFYHHLKSCRVKCYGYRESNQELLVAQWASNFLKFLVP